MFSSSALISRPSSFFQIGVTDLQGIHKALKLFYFGDQIAISSIKNVISFPKLSFMLIPRITEFLLAIIFIWLH